MKQELRVRIRVIHPLTGADMRVQRGRDELLEPSTASAAELVFDFPIAVDLTADKPNFLGKYAQGPKDARFIYVNSGTYAGQHSAWSRRAKLPLMSVTKRQVEEVVANGGVLETQFQGIGRDGGPTCATVKELEWNVVPG